MRPAATLGAFTRSLYGNLPRELNRAGYLEAVEATLRSLQYRRDAAGLRAHAVSLFERAGDDPQRLREAMERLTGDADDLAMADRPDFKLKTDAERRSLPEALGLRTGRRGDADLLDAFDVNSLGVPALLTRQIHDTTRPPNDVAAWASQAIAALQADGINMSPADARQLVEALTQDVAAWQASAEAREGMKPAQRVMGTLQGFLKDLKDPDAQALRTALSAAGQKFAELRTEPFIAACIALTALEASRLAVGSNSLPKAARNIAGAAAGWYAADLAGATFHWFLDNYLRGVKGDQLPKYMFRQFHRHHDKPKEVSTWPLTRNTDMSSRSVLPLLALLALREKRGMLSAGLLAMGNGILYGQHLHGFSHRPANVPTPPLIRLLQKARLVISPEEHVKHHSRPVGREYYAIINGWSNWLLDKSNFFRTLEGIIEKQTGTKPQWVLDEADKVAAIADKNARAAKRARRPATPSA